MASFLIYFSAAIAEIFGCFAIWNWLRLDKSAIWAVPGVVALLLFAVLLTHVDASYAGRAYAGYGGVYIATSLAWMWLVEGAPPDRWDVIGASFCILGAAIILLAPRAV